MIKNKHISKITMLTALFIGGIVNAQEFYTCVPKKSWWSDTMGESIKRNVPSANDIARAISGTTPKLQPIPKPEKKWKFLRNIPFENAEISLPVGKYKLKVCDIERNFEFFTDEKLKITAAKILCSISKLCNLLTVSFLDKTVFEPANIENCSTLSLYKYE